MKLSEIATLLDAKILCCEDSISYEVFSAFGSDMMSDVLAFVRNQAVLLTGLINPQVIRTAMMMDLKCIVFVRNKQPSEEMIELAKEAGIVLLATGKRLYDASGILYSNGLRESEV